MTGLGVRPYLWMLGSAVAFATMSTFAHALRHAVPWQTIAFARAAIPMCIAGVLLAVARLKWPFPGHVTLWLRSCAGSVSLVCTFYALTRLPVSDVLTLCNLTPLWVSVLSWPMLGHRPSWDVWVSVAVGLAGVVLIQQTHVDGGHLLASTSAVVASLSSAVALISLHRLEGLDPRAIVFHFSLVALGMCVAVSFHIDRFVSNAAAPVISGPAAGALLAGVGLAATVGQFCLTKAYLTGSPARVSVVGLSQVGIGMVIDLIFWQRSFSSMTILGIALVVGSTAWAMLSRSQEVVPAAVPDTGPPSAAPAEAPPV